MSVLTAIITGLVVGYLGVLLALKQFKAQRAFDRQLEWYERTIRALARFSSLSRQIALARQLQSSKLLSEAWQQMERGVADLEQCVNEAVLYADQRSYEQLSRMGEKYEELKNRVTSEIAGDEPDPTKIRRTSEWIAQLEDAESAETERVNEVLRETFFELSTPIRKMLGLKAVKLRNFK